MYLLWQRAIQFFPEIDRGEKKGGLWRQSLWNSSERVNFGKKLNGESGLGIHHPPHQKQYQMSNLSDMLSSEIATLRAQAAALLSKAAALESALNALARVAEAPVAVAPVAVAPVAEAPVAVAPVAEAVVDALRGAEGVP